MIHQMTHLVVRLHSIATHDMEDGHQTTGKSSYGIIGQPTFLC